MSKVFKEIKELMGDKFILVVDPAVNYRTTIKNFFTNLKIKNFRIVGSVAEAKREMLAIKVGFFVCEWQLPEKNGLAFCRELRKDKAYKSTPFLLLSTENFRKDVVLAVEGGVNGYLIKPFNYDDFVSQIQTLLMTESQPNPINSLLERAESHIDLGEIWVAESLVKEALAIRDSSARAHAALGRIRLLQKDKTQAQLEFLRATEVNPEYIDGYKYLLQIAEESKAIDDIFNTATILNNLSPENPRYPLIIARVLMDKGNLDESERHFKISVKLSPTLADGYRGLGSVYMKKKEFAKATKALEKALDLEKQDIPTLNSLGLSYVKQGLIDEGILRYKMALAIDCKDARVLFNLGLAYDEKGDLNGATDALSKAIASDPSFEKAKRQLDRIAKGQPLSEEEKGNISESLDYQQFLKSS